ncbi:unnamed protein product [Staurois parvus]|uniref:Uncharacterized protein n=1 Tax=Staurois parvus TaxID=386267 RepID=A0ABN9AJQ3_9NEOB|nr:unnamed protein product [Staurois parvus]
MTYLQNVKRKTLFFFKMFRLFNLYSEKIKIPVVNKYHQKKALSVSQNYKNFVWVQCCIAIQNATALKAENWPGQEGGERAREASG